MNFTRRLNRGNNWCKQGLNKNYDAGVYKQPRPRSSRPVNFHRVKHERSRDSNRHRELPPIIAQERIIYEILRIKTFLEMVVI